jgi:hypothetical protein
MVGIKPGSQLHLEKDQNIMASLRDGEHGACDERVEDRLPASTAGALGFFDLIQCGERPEA